MSSGSHRFFFFFSTELLVQCDGCLSWSWVLRAGLMAGLQVGQADEACQHISVVVIINK